MYEQKETEQSCRLERREAGDIIQKQQILCLAILIYQLFNDKTEEFILEQMPQLYYSQEINRQYYTPRATSNAYWPKAFDAQFLLEEIKKAYYGRLSFEELKNKVLEKIS